MARRVYYHLGGRDALPWALELAYRCYDMPAGILRHLPESGGALGQSDLILLNMSYAVKTWQVYKKRVKDHTDEDIDWMRNVVKPDRGF